MLSVTPSMVARSSLEEMLEALEQREEVERPKDLPPKLPSRPTSMARRPSSKRPLLNDFGNSFTKYPSVKKDSCGGGFDAKKDCAMEEARDQVLLGTLKLQKWFRSYQARRYFQELKTGVIPLQSLIRGWLARNQIKVLHNLKLDQNNTGSAHSPSRMTSKVKQEMPTTVEELQSRVLKAEKNLEKKEQENAALRTQVQQYEARWLEYEGKMKSTEAMWQKQTTSLHMSQDNAVSHLMKEFEQQKQTFDDEVKAIVDVKSGQSANADPDEDLRKLKTKFKKWRKDYKARLREAKTKHRKLGVSDAETRRRKWWLAISKRH